MQLSEGSYYGRLTEAGTASLNNDAQTPFVWLRFALTHHARAGNWSPMAQTISREVRMFLSEKAWPYTVEKLEKLAFDGNFAQPLFDGELNTQGCELLCEHESRDGKLFEEWSIAKCIGGREKADVPARMMNILKSKWRHRAAPSPPSTPNRPDDDESAGPVALPSPPSPPSTPGGITPGAHLATPGGRMERDNLRRRNDEPDPDDVAW